MNHSRLDSTAFMTPNEEVNRKDELPPEVSEIALVRSSAYSIQSLSVAGLFVLAILYSLYFAAEFILPVVLAFLMSLSLLPSVRVLRKARIPEPVGAAIAILALVILLLGVGSLVTRPFARFLQDFPLYLDKIRDRISFLSDPLEELSQASKRVEQMIGASQGSTLLVDLKQ